jgi:hypothetical protein
MSVYVDATLWKLGPMKMCHMIADTEAELHAMADKIGIDRRHYQRNASTPHYDVCKSKRAQAVRLGAIECNRKGFVAVIKRLRTQRESA